MRQKLPIAAAFVISVAQSLAMGPSPAAEQAFRNYIAQVEARRGTPSASKAHTQRVPWQRIEPVNGGTWNVNGGLLHHWRGDAFVPGATVQEMLALLRDYKNLSTYYAPEIVSSRVLAERGNVATVEIRFKERMAITVVLDAEFEIESAIRGDRGYSISRSVHIWQVDNAGTPRERRRAEGHDDGCLWHLNSYWSFVQCPGGLLMECDAVSLTRNIPTGLGWLITPIIRDLPRQRLQFTLAATAKALATRAKEER